MNGAFQSCVAGLTTLERGPVDDIVCRGHNSVLSGVAKGLAGCVFSLEFLTAVADTVLRRNVLCHR